MERFFWLEIFWPFLPLRQNHGRSGHAVFQARLPTLGRPLSPVLTVSFLGSLSTSRRRRDVLTLRASDRAIKPPVLISFSLRSRRSSLGLSAMNSATATAPAAHRETRAGTKQQQAPRHSTTAAEPGGSERPPSQDSLVEARPSRSTERLAISPSFSLWTPSLPTELWPRFRVSRLCVHGCKRQRRGIVRFINIHAFVFLLMQSQVEVEAGLAEGLRPFFPVGETFWDRARPSHTPLGGVCDV